MQQPRQRQRHRRGDCARRQHREGNSGRGIQSPVISTTTGSMITPKTTSTNSPMTSRSACSSSASRAEARSLSMTASTPCSLPCSSYYWSESATAGADHDRAPRHQAADRANLEDALRFRAGHHPAELVAVRREVHGRQTLGGLPVDTPARSAWWGGRTRDRRGPPRSSSAAWRTAGHVAAGCPAPARMT